MRLAASEVPIHEVATCEQCGATPRICAEFSLSTVGGAALLCRDCVHRGYLALLAATNDDQCPGIPVDDGDGCDSIKHCAGCLHGD